MTGRGWVALVLLLTLAVFFLAYAVMLARERAGLAADLEDALADLEDERVERARAEGALEGTLAWVTRRSA